MVSLDVYNKAFKNYIGGVIKNIPDHEVCPPYSEIDGFASHAMLAIGWGHDNNNEKYGGDYVILLNSWGSTWGDKGIMRLSLQDEHSRPGRGMCGIYLQMV